MGSWPHGLSKRTNSQCRRISANPALPTDRPGVIVILVMFILGMARMLVDILVRAIIISRVRGWGFWMFGALWDTAFQVAVSPFRWAIEKGKEGAGRIRNQMEARAAYVPGQPQEEEQDNVEVLADWAASWRRRVYGMAPPLQAGGGNVGGANLPIDGGGAGAINGRN